MKMQTDFYSLSKMLPPIFSSYIQLFNLTVKKKVYTHLFYKNKVNYTYHYLFFKDLISVFF